VRRGVELDGGLEHRDGILHPALQGHRSRELQEDLRMRAAIYVRLSKEERQGARGGTWAPQIVLLAEVSR
jgi:hypothetical protein